MRLDEHRGQYSLQPDGMHTIKDFTQNLFNMLLSNKHEQSKICACEEKHRTYTETLSGVSTA